jgi:hypothetical protein
MKFQTILFVGIMCLAPLLDAKRMPGVTRSRNKNNKPSVRRNQHGHDMDENPLPPVRPKAPEVKKPAPNMQSPSAPVGPPPAYPGMGHHAAPPYGAPPAYNPSYSNPPSYSPGFNQQRFGQTPGAYNQPGSYSHAGGYNQFSSPGMMSHGGMSHGGGMMPMGGGVMPMAASPYGYGGGYGGGRSGGSGIMTNLFAGLAGYQLARAFSGGSHHNRDREIIVIDNRQPDNANPAQVTNTDQTTGVQAPPESIMNQYSTEIPQPPVTQVVPEMNEYNYWGFPQYGVPLYGYSLPAQITDYYSVAVISKPQEQTQPIYEQTQEQTQSRK